MSLSDAWDPPAGAEEAQSAPWSGECSLASMLLRRRVGTYD